MHHNRVVMAVDMCVDPIESLKELLDCALEVFREGGADARGEYGFVVDEGLRPSHQVFDVLWRAHLGRFRVASRGVLPKVFESRNGGLADVGMERGGTYSSVAFISGQL